MTGKPRLTLASVTLDSSDAGELATFYKRLLGWKIGAQEPDWVTLRSPDGGAGLSFQTEAAYVAPVWPATPGRPQMLVHLDIVVEDLEAASAHAVAVGATVAQFQPQEHVRVHLDPAGHPFCLHLPKVRLHRPEVPLYPPAA